MNYLKLIGKNQIEIIGFSHLTEKIYVKKTIMSNSIVLKTNSKFLYDYVVEVNEQRITDNQQFLNDIARRDLFNVQFLFLEDVKSYICTFSKIESHSD